MTISKLAPVAFAALALVGCDAADTDANTEAAPLATEIAAPPGAGGLTLDIDGILEAGNQITFTVSGADPGASVFLAMGSGDGPCAITPAPLGGLCIDVANPQLMPIPQNPLQANASGVASVTLTVPPTLPAGFERWFQAAQPGTAATAATSNVVPKFVPRDTGRIMTVDLLEISDVVPGVSLDGTRFEIYYSITNGLDTCVIEWEASSTGLGSLPACANCTFAFDITYANAVDGSVSGDCDYFFGIDPTTLASFNDGFGYDPNYYVPGYTNYPVAFFYYDVGGYWTWLTTGVNYNAGEFVWQLTQLGYYLY